MAQPSLSDLEQAAVRAHAEWFRLAADLDVRVARMLPCDAAAIDAIEQTNRASAARLTALSDYVSGLIERAAGDAAQARQIQRAETAYLTSVGTERTDTELERARIETQLNHLLENVRKKVSLTTASEELRALEAAVRERAEWITRNASAAENRLSRYEEFVAALDRREATLRKLIPAIEEERTKWNGYYTARLARARTECVVTGAAR
jgi:chromosome segregation ATPase